MSGFADSINRSQQHIDSIASSLGNYFTKKQASEKERALYEQLKKNQAPSETITKTLLPRKQLASIGAPAVQQAEIPPQAAQIQLPPTPQSAKVGGLPVGDANESGPLGSAPTAVPFPMNAKPEATMLDAKPTSAVLPQVPQVGATVPGTGVPVVAAGAYDKMASQMPTTQTVENTTYGETPSVEEAAAKTFQEHPELLNTPAGKAYLENLTKMHALNSTKISGAPIESQDPSDPNYVFLWNKHSDGSVTPVLGADGRQLRKQKNQSQTGPEYDSSYWIGKITSAKSNTEKQEAINGLNEALKYEGIKDTQKQERIGDRMINVANARPFRRAFKDDLGNWTMISVDPSTGAETINKIEGVGTTSGNFMPIKDNLGRVTSIVNAKTGKVITAEQMGLTAFTEAPTPTTIKNAAANVPAVRNVIADATVALDQIGDNFGPIQGRLSDLFYNKVGEENPAYRALNTQLHLIGSKMMQVHAGSRGSNLLFDAFDKMIGSNNQTPENIKASLAEMNRYLGYIEDEAKNFGKSDGLQDKPKAGMKPMIDQTKVKKGGVIDLSGQY